MTIYACVPECNGASENSENDVGAQLLIYRREKDWTHHPVVFNGETINLMSQKLYCWFILQLYQWFLRRLGLNFPGKWGWHWKHPHVEPLGFRCQHLAVDLNRYFWLLQQSIFCWLNYFTIPIIYTHPCKLKRSVQSQMGSLWWQVWNRPQTAWIWLDKCRDTSSSHNQFQGLGLSHPRKLQLDFVRDLAEIYYSWQSPLSSQPSKVELALSGGLLSTTGYMI